jgi:transposase InsO family protein
MVPDGPDQLWVADITYVAIASGFVYVAVILDAWSRRVVGYAISRSIDARLTIAALKAAVRSRAPPAGCVHHSDRGSQYAAAAYRKLLADHKLTGSMGRRGNPYDNAKAKSFMKTLKVEAVYPMAYETGTKTGSSPGDSSSLTSPPVIVPLVRAISRDLAQKRDADLDEHRLASCKAVGDDCPPEA